MISHRHLYNIRKINDHQNSTIDKIIEYVYLDNFPEILLKDKSTFINKIESQIIEMIKLNNKGKEFNNNSDILLYQNKKPLLLSRYEYEYSLLNSQYEKYRQSPNEISYLTKIIKHCVNQDNIPLHKCDMENKFGKFIEVINNKKDLNNSSKSNDYKNNNYVICTKCRFCNIISFIKIFCSDCKCVFFSYKLNNNEDENILPATWKEYHCNVLINEKMKCIKCGSILYINLITKQLICLNKKCNFSAIPRSIIWKCKICKKDFRSSIKVYNPLESKILQNEIWRSLIYKQKAYPKNNLCCLKNEKNENIRYYHDKFCKGELYKGNVNGNEIIVCGKCHAVNFYDKFIWTCPKCNKKINNHKDVKEKKDNNNNSNNNNINIKVKNNLKPMNENKSTNNINELSLNQSKEKAIKIFNNKSKFIFQYFFTEKKNNKNNSQRINKINETEKKIAKLKQDLTMPTIQNNSFLNKNIEKIENKSKNNIIKKIFFKKKIKYKKTLLDILEEREKYKLDNKSIEGNKNEQEKKETIKLDKSLINMKFNKRRTKLLGESNLNTSKKNYRKILFQQSLSPQNISNTNNMLINSNENNEQIIKINLFNKSLKDIKKLSTDEEDTDRKTYKNLIYSKIYKEEHSTTTNDENEKIEIIKHNKTYMKNPKINFDFKKKYLKEPDFCEIKITPKKKSDKKKFQEENKLFKKVSVTNTMNNSLLKRDKSQQNSNIRKKNQLIKQIYLDKINIKKQDRFARSRDNIKQNILKEVSKQFIEINNNTNINYINNKSIINISPFGDINKNFISKEVFLNISKDCKIPPFQEDDIKYINSIGMGSYGVIYLVEDKLAKKKYALKRVICQDISKIIKIKKEFELCYNLNHPNIIKIYNIYFKYIDSITYLLYILMEKAESDWENLIEKRAETKNYYKEGELINTLKQLVNAMVFLQEKGIAHRNIKPKNILICENNIYKITDLCEAKQNNNEKELSTLKGSQLFMSPNLFFVLKYDGNSLKINHNVFKSDVFSLGYCFLYAMALDIKLIKNIREEKSMDNIISKIKKYKMNERYSEKLMNIIYKMIQTDENKRYDFIELNEEINQIII